MNRRWPRLGLALLLVAAVGIGVALRDRFDAAALQLWVAEAGWLAPLLFIAVYSAATVLFLPGSPLTLVGGALFGPWLGTLVNLVAATIGATLAFLVARYVAADAVRQRAGPRLGRVIDGVAAEGWRFVAFTRLVPLFPFNLLNYVLGLTGIRLLPYLLASFIFMAPGTFAYTWLGFAGREAITGGEGLVQTILLALALLAATAFLPLLVRRLRGERGAERAGRDTAS